MDSGVWVGSNNQMTDEQIARWWALNKNTPAPRLSRYHRWIKQNGFIDIKNGSVAIRSIDGV